jgi:hypothetical protein
MQPYIFYNFNRLLGQNNYKNINSVGICCRPIFGEGIQIVISDDKCMAYLYIRFRFSVALRQLSQWPCSLCPCLLLKMEVQVDIIQSQSHVATGGQSVNPSRFRAPSGAHEQIVITVGQLQICRCEVPSLTRGRVSFVRIIVIYTLYSLSVVNMYIVFTVLHV